MDLEALFLYPNDIEPFAAQLAEQLRACDAEVVCGPLVEGAFLALLVARQLGIPFTYSERFSYCEGRELYPYGYRIPEALHHHLAGKRVLIVNDVISAGSAVRGTAAALDQLEARVVGLGALLVLGHWTAEFARERVITPAILSAAENEWWAPPECPLCKNGVPLERKIQSS
jgi:orotate phosphoribosyltransferase